MKLKENMCQISEKKECKKRDLLGRCPKKQYTIYTKGNCKEVLRYKRKNFNIKLSDLSLIKNNFSL